MATDTPIDPSNRRPGDSPTLVFDAATEEPPAAARPGHGGRHRHPRAPHARRTRAFVVVTLAAATALGVTALLLPTAFARLRGEAAPVKGSTWASPPNTTQSPAPATQPRTPQPGSVDIEVDGFFSWALLDRRTGKVTGSDNVSATSPAESMVTVWIVADYLRRTAETGATPSATRLAQASAAIRSSDDRAAQTLYRAGGGDAQIRRMISMCELADTTVHEGAWSRTRISARDSVRLGACVADGRAAGPQWTDWVRKEMTKVRGGSAGGKDQLSGGRWGIIDGLPKDIIARGVGIKNGWTSVAAEGRWHVNCLAVADDWALAVLLRYPTARGLSYGAWTCADVASRLLPTAAPAV